MSTIFACLSANAADGVTTIHMAGDSTMAIKDVKDYPETGWGVPFSIFFDNTVEVRNYAQNGRSTRTFIELGLWQRIFDHLQPGDFVIIEFGHNDEADYKPDRYTTPEQYKTNLTRFITETRQKGATPILLTPITRRKFDKNGEIQETHAYTPLCIEVAKATDVEFIDMDAVTRDYFQAMGDRDSAVRFMHIPPDTHPNYPNGVRDDTHLNHLGAREVAQLFLAELKRRGHPLASRLRVPDPKHLQYSY
jgi:lysophospholipase L1-like esterase